MDKQSRALSFSLKVITLLMIMLLSYGSTQKLLLMPPFGIDALQPTNMDSFIGPWFEIARIDNAVEAGMNPVQIFFKPGPASDDGKTYEVTLIGRTRANKDRLTKLAAAWVGEDDAKGSLEVSCGYGFFKCGLHVIDSSESKQQWLMLTGPTKRNLWIVAREPALNERTLKSVLEQAEGMGFDTESVILTKNKMPVSPQMPARTQTPLPADPPRPKLPNGEAEEHSSSGWLMPLPMPAGPPPMPAGPPPMPAGPPPMPAGPPPMPAAAPPMPAAAPPMPAGPPPMP